MNSPIATPLELLLIEITLSDFRQISILLLPTSRSPFNDWWARSYFFKLALALTYCLPSSFFLSTAHLPNTVTLRLPSGFCSTSKGLNHTVCKGPKGQANSLSMYNPRTDGNDQGGDPLSPPCLYILHR